MNAEQLVGFARANDSDPYVNYEIDTDVVVVRYHNRLSTAPVIALATRDGRHRFVMVDGYFYPNSALANLEGDDEDTLNVIEQQEDQFRVWLEVQEAIRDFVLTHTDDQLMLLKEEWTNEAKAA